MMGNVCKLNVYEIFQQLVFTLLQNAFHGDESQYKYADNIK